MNQYTCLCVAFRNRTGAGHHLLMTGAVRHLLEPDGRRAPFTYDGHDGRRAPFTYDPFLKNFFSV